MARKLHEPANERYQFGYAKYEPLMTTVEGVLLAGACVGAIVYAVRDLIHKYRLTCLHCKCTVSTTKGTTHRLRD